MLYSISQIRCRHGEMSFATGYRRRRELEELGAAGLLHLRRLQAWADYLYPVQETAPVLRRSASPTDGSSRWRPKNVCVFFSDLQQELIQGPQQQ